MTSFTKEELDFAGMSTPEWWPPEEAFTSDEWDENMKNMRLWLLSEWDKNPPPEGISLDEYLLYSNVMMKRYFQEVVGYVIQ